MERRTVVRSLRYCSCAGLVSWPSEPAPLECSRLKRRMCSLARDEREMKRSPGEEPGEREKSLGSSGRGDEERFLTEGVGEEEEEEGEEKGEAEGGGRSEAERIGEEGMGRLEEEGMLEEEEEEDEKGEDDDEVENGFGEDEVEEEEEEEWREGEGKGEEESPE